MSGSNPLAVALGQVGQSNPLQFAQGYANLATKAQALKTSQFNLGQAQQGLGYQAMRMLQATNSDPSDADVQAALGSATRQGGVVDGLVQDYTAWRARGGTPGDFVRSRALGGMSPEAQYSQTGPQFQARQTDQGTYYGVVGGAATPNANVFTPSGFVSRGFTPEWGATRVPVVGPDGITRMVPQGALQPGGGAATGGAPTGAAPAGGAQGGGGAGAGAVTSPGGAVNNFGNIGGPGHFASYATPQDGIAAMTQQLVVNQDQHGRNTLRGTITRWLGGVSDDPAMAYAQANQGGNNVNAYVNAVANATNINPDAPIDFHDPATLAKIIPAMAQVEHGRPMGVGGDVLAAGITAGLTGRPAAAPGGPQGGPFIGATSAQPVAGGAAGAPPGGAVRPAGGAGMQYFPASPGSGGAGGGIGGGAGIPGVGAMTPYGAVLTPPPPGTVQSLETTAAGSTQRSQALQQQMNAAVSQRAMLEGMEADLYRMPSTGVATGALGTIKNLLVQSGMLSPAEADRQAQGLSAQEQFDKFSAMLNQQLLSGMGGQATDARQELTGAATPSSVHSVLGNLGIIHMLEGNLTATQVMGREFQSDVLAGRVTPAQFDAWRDNFTKPGPGGARFDPRVFWIAAMQPQEQQSYINSLTPKDRAQLLKNANYAESKGWVSENQDHSMGSNY